MKKEEAIKIAKEYPESIKCIPRGAFIDQLANFLMKIKEKKLI